MSALRRETHHRRRARPASARDDSEPVPSPAVQVVVNRCDVAKHFPDTACIAGPFVCCGRGRKRPDGILERFAPAAAVQREPRLRRVSACRRRPTAAPPEAARRFSSRRSQRAGDEKLADISTSPLLYVDVAPRSACRGSCCRPASSCRPRAVIVVDHGSGRRIPDLDPQPVDLRPTFLGVHGRRMNW